MVYQVLGGSVGTIKDLIHNGHFTQPCSSFKYEPIAGWVSTRTVLVRSGNLAWGGLSTAAGSNYVALQGHGARISQVVQHLNSGKLYSVTFTAAARPREPKNMKPVHDGLKVEVDGKTVFAKVLPPRFQAYRVQFEANQTGTVALAFENDTPGAEGDRSVLVADVGIHQEGISDSATLNKWSKINNGHFTQQVVPCNGGPHWGFKYEPIAGWVSTRTVLVRSGNLAWGGLSTAAGSNYVALQGHGARISQVVQHLNSGKLYSVTFTAAARPREPKNMKPVHDGLKVEVDGKTVFAKVLPPRFQAYRVQFEANQTGTVALAFENDTPGAEGDRSVFVTDVLLMVDRQAEVVKALEATRAAEITTVSDEAAAKNAAEAAKAAAEAANAAAEVALGELKAVKKTIKMTEAARDKLRMRAEAAPDAASSQQMLQRLRQTLDQDSAASSKQMLQRLRQTLDQGEHQGEAEQDTTSNHKLLQQLRQQLDQGTKHVRNTIKQPQSELTDNLSSSRKTIVGVNSVGSAGHKNKSLIVAIGVIFVALLGVIAYVCHQRAFVWASTAPSGMEMNHAWKFPNYWGK